LRMSRIHWGGGSRTSPFIPDSLRWHCITYQYQVSSSATISILDLMVNIATSVDVEQVFSKGRLVLPHVQNRLSVQSTCALLCLGA
jgi:hypothetical protein